MPKRDEAPNRSSISSKEQDGVAAHAKHAPRKSKLFVPFTPRRLVAVIIRLAHCPQMRPHLMGENLAEFGLAGAGRAIKQDVRARLCRNA